MVLNKTTVGDVFNFLDRIAPFELQCSWDNSGLIIGSAEKEVNKIGIVLDITPEAVEAAQKIGVDLIVSHHPVIFHPMKSVDADSAVYKMINFGISAICAHTSLDTAKGGVSDVLAGLLGAKEILPVCSDGEASVCRMFEIETTTAEHFAETVSERLGACVRYSNPEKEVKRVAVCGGSGAEFAAHAKKSGCDAFVTGDASHHEFLDAAEMDIALIAAGHFETENPIVEVLFNKIKNEFNTETVIIPQAAPIKYIMK